MKRKDSQNQRVAKKFSFLFILFILYFYRCFVINYDKCIWNETTAIGNTDRIKKKCFRDTLHKHDIWNIWCKLRFNPFFHQIHWLNNICFSIDLKLVQILSNSKKINFFLSCISFFVDAILIHIQFHKFIVSIDFIKNFVAGNSFFDLNLKMKEVCNMYISQCKIEFISILFISFHRAGNAVETVES